MNKNPHGTEDAMALTENITNNDNDQKQEGSYIKCEPHSILQNIEQCDNTKFRIGPDAGAGDATLSAEEMESFMTTSEEEGQGMECEFSDLTVEEVDSLETGENSRNLFIMLHLCIN